MNFDGLGAASLEAGSFNVNDKLSAFNKSFDNSITGNYDAYFDMPDSVDGNIARWLGIDTPDINTPDMAAGIAAMRSTVMDTVKQMYSGTILENGKLSLGLERISQWKVNPDYVESNLKQHAGYAAEVLSTAKENLQAKLENTGVKTFRTDDRPDLFPHNDQYVDKIRVDSAGNVLEKIQTKFVGKDAKSCLSKLMSKGYDKYFQDGADVKMEVPKDYYDEIKRLIPEKVAKLQESLERVTADGKEEVAKKIEAKIEKYKILDQKLEQSTVSYDEATEAVKHPKRVSARLFAKDTLLEGNKAGLESAALAATITVAVSTVDNITQVMDGKITAQEAFLDVAKDTGAAGGIAYGTTFVSTAVAQAMSSSAHQMIRALGNTGVPAMVVSVGVQSYDSITDYATGVIDAKELVSDLAENTAQVAGSMAGAAAASAIAGAAGTVITSAAAGAAAGSVVPGFGTAVGAVAGVGVSLVGGMVGAAVATEAYKSAVRVAAPGADVLADKAQEMATKTIDAAKECLPGAVDEVRGMLNTFLAQNEMPFSI